MLAVRITFGRFCPVTIGANDFAVRSRVQYALSSSKVLRLTRRSRGVPCAFPLWRIEINKAVQLLRAFTGHRYTGMSARDLLSGRDVQDPENGICTVCGGILVKERVSGMERTRCRGLDCSTACCTKCDRHARLRFENICLDCVAVPRQNAIYDCLTRRVSKPA